jgi:hypothetical protein
MQEELWKDIPGHKDYQASTFGRIKSFRQTDPNGKMLKQGLVGSSNKYLSVCLFSPNRKTILAHKLVALTFIGPRPDKLVIDHIDNDPMNNRADNLQYITSQKNNAKDRAEDHYSKRKRNEANNRWI